MKTGRISEKRFEEKLAGLLERVLKRSGGYISTFRQAGVQGNNKGLVVRLGSGQKFQITIVDGSDRVRKGA